ncbi:MAG: discoidin domain-containing protein [Pseudomonadota bacterium]
MNLRHLLTAAVLSLITALPFASAQAAQVKLAGASASSFYPPGEGVTYNEGNLKDGKVSTVWVEGEEGSGLGSWVELDLGGPHTITHIRIWNGNWYSWDFWNRHNRAKEIEIQFSDETTIKHTLKDEKVAEDIRFEKPVTTSSVKIKIKGIYRGSTFNDTCISEVAVFDQEPEKFHVVAGTADSGHLPEDADGTYEVSNTYDQLIDTMWCENQKAGDGTGAWIEYRFGQAVPVGHLALLNGNAYDTTFWRKSNRAEQITLSFSDGTSEVLEVKDFIMLQNLTFPARVTSSVRITFDKVKRGTEYNDLCVSEARFTE